MSDYFEWESFENIYLEDSYVLNIYEGDAELTFSMELVLTENHPLYSPPQNREMYCYRRGKLIFEDVKQIKWVNKRLLPITGIDQEVDFGNIDYLELDKDTFHLGGEWGEIYIQADYPKIMIA